MNDSADDPDLLYHYTNAEGLLGILSTSQFWATDFQFLNDTSELTLGRQELAEALRADADDIEMNHRGAAYEANPGVALPIDGDEWQLRAKVSRYVADLLKRPRVDVEGPYVVCFCEDGDLLSQWRGYGRNGYALGFRRDELAKPFPVDGTNAPGSPTPVAELTKVRYGKKEAQATVASVLPTIAPYPMSGINRSAHVPSANAALMTLSSLKDSSFREEREWRLVVDATLGGVKPNVRVRQGDFVPYAVVRLDGAKTTEDNDMPLVTDRLRYALKKIFVGPQVTDQRIRGLRKALLKHRFYKTEVCESTIPYVGE